MPIDPHRTAVSDSLAQLNEARLAGGYAPVNGLIDGGTAELVQGIFEICQTAGDAHGNVRPLFLPSLCLCHLYPVHTSIGDAWGISSRCSIGRTETVD
jgi:hypothetical protein